MNVNNLFYSEMSLIIDMDLPIKHFKSQKLYVKCKSFIAKLSVLLIISSLILILQVTILQYLQFTSRRCHLKGRTFLPNRLVSPQDGVRSHLCRNPHTEGLKLLKKTSWKMERSYEDGGFGLTCVLN